MFGYKVIKRDCTKMTSEGCPQGFSSACATKCKLGRTCINDVCNSSLCVTAKGSKGVIGKDKPKHKTKAIKHRFRGFCAWFKDKKVSVLIFFIIYCV